MEMRKIVWDAKNDAQKNLVIDSVDFFKVPEEERPNYKSVLTGGWKNVKVEVVQRKNTDLVINNNIFSFYRTVFC